MNPSTTTDYHVTGLQFVIAIITLVLMWGFKFMQEWMKDRRDRKRDVDQIDVLREISKDNKGIRLGQIEQNGKLAAVVQVNESHHAELIRCLDRLPCTISREQKVD